MVMTSDQPTADRVFALLRWYAGACDDGYRFAPPILRTKDALSIRWIASVRTQ